MVNLLPIFTVVVRHRTTSMKKPQHWLKSLNIGKMLSFWKLQYMLHRITFHQSHHQVSTTLLKKQDRMDWRKNSLIFFVPLLVPPFLSKSHGLIQLHIWQQCEKMFSHDGMQRLRTKLCKQVHNAHPSQLELNVKQTMEARTKQLCKRKPQCNCENTSMIAKHELLVYNWL